MRISPLFVISGALLIVAAALVYLRFSKVTPGAEPQHIASKAPTLIENKGSMAEQKLDAHNAADPAPVSQYPGANEVNSNTQIEMQDLTAKPAEGAPAQAVQARITRDNSGKVIETAYLNKAGHEIQILRETEDGQLRAERTVDPTGKLLRERVFLNGHLKSERREER